MFSKTIIDSDAYLDMPLSTQALYFHLSMRADDEGFVNNPRKIQRMIGASDDDLKLLVSKNFIIPFDSGVVVIKHWRRHNYIRADRLVPTNYKDERACLCVKGNGAYTFRRALDCQLTDECQSSDGQMSAQDRIVEDSIGEGRKGEDRIGEGRGEDLTAAAVQPDALAIYASNNLTYLSPGNMDELLSFRDSLSDDMIMYAIDAACGAGKRTYDYVRSILNRIIERGFKSLGEVKAAEDERRAKKDSAAASPIAQSIQRAKLAHRPMDERPVTDDEFEFDVMALMNRPRSGGAQ
jgi:DnaD/phage-associated family protein